MNYKIISINDQLIIDEDTLVSIEMNLSLTQPRPSVKRLNEFLAANKSSLRVVEDG